MSEHRCVKHLVFSERLEAKPGYVAHDVMICTMCTATYWLAATAQTERPEGVSGPEQGAAGGEPTIRLGALPASALRVLILAVDYTRDPETCPGSLCSDDGYTLENLAEWLRAALRSAPPTPRIEGKDWPRG